MEAAVVLPASRWNTAVASASLSCRLIPSSVHSRQRTKAQDCAAPPTFTDGDSGSAQGYGLGSLSTLTHSQHLQAFRLELSFASFRGILAKPIVFRLTTCG